VSAKRVIRSNAAFTSAASCSASLETPAASARDGSSVTRKCSVPRSRSSIGAVS
jgi:hypothetical protein